MRYAPTVADAMALVSENYIEPVERRTLYQNAMTGMLNRLDKYSSYMPPVDYEELREELDQKFAGVGIEVGIDPDTRRLMVLSPIVDSPAHQAGLQAGDLIMEIDGTDTEGMQLKDSVERMRGKPGTGVALIVQPFETTERRNVTVIRQPVRIGSVLGDSRNRDGEWHFRLDDNPSIAYLRIVNFGDATAEELAESLEPLLDSTDGAIIDVRGNPGGLLDAAVNVCDLFLGACPVVSVRRRGGFNEPNRIADARDAVVVETYESTSTVVVPKDYPVAVLIDRYSASASEIVAACLQDYHRAVIVGQRSWGKGTVQNVFDLEGGRSAMKLTTATYWRPSGTNIHRFSTDKEDDTWGVRPDQGYEVVYTDEEIATRFADRRARDFVKEVRQGRVDRDKVSPPFDDTSPEKVPDDESPDGESPDDEEPATDAAPDDHRPGPDSIQPADDEPMDREPADDDGAAAIGGDAADELTEATSDEPLVDRQLERAVEYIKSQRVEPIRKAA